MAAEEFEVGDRMTEMRNIDTIDLARGQHHSPDDGLCLLEATAYLAGEPHSDHPKCASHVIATFGRVWNDALDDRDRQQLKRYAARLIGTAASGEIENARAWMAFDWLVRDYTPIWLRFAGLAKHGDQLADLPEFVAGMDVSVAFPAIEAARSAAAAAGPAMGAVAGAAARDAAGAAAWDAARAVAGDAAWDAARDAAWAAAGDAAWAAAWDAAGAVAGAAARDAAGDGLRPAINECQRSAFQLLNRMIAAYRAQQGESE